MLRLLVVNGCGVCPLLLARCACCTGGLFLVSVFVVFGGSRAVYLECWLDGSVVFLVGGRNGFMNG